MSNDDETYEVILLKIQETFSEHEKSSLALRETQWTIDQNSCLPPHVGCRVTPAKVREKGISLTVFQHMDARICACALQL